jgi:hypothetical protein
MILLGCGNDWRTSCGRVCSASAGLGQQAHADPSYVGPIVAMRLQLWFSREAVSNMAVSGAGLVVVVAR